MTHEPYGQSASAAGKAHFDDHKKFRERIEGAGRSHQAKKAEIERAHAAALLRAKDLHGAAVAVAPKRMGQDGSGRTFEVADSQAIQAIDAAYRKALEDTEAAHLAELKKAVHEHTQDVDTARREWRKSPGWMPNHE